MIDTDKLIERLRERISDSSDNNYAGGYCDNCNAQLTRADIDNDRTCTNCGSSLDADDEGLEEDLLEVEQDDYNLGWL